MEGIYLEFDEPLNGNLSIDNFYSCYTEGYIKGAVKQLSIDNNNITRNAFELISELKYLTLLYLSDNKIKKLPLCLSKLKFLENLYLSNNEITEVPLVLLKETDPCLVDLSSNNISLSKNEVEMLEEKYDIDLFKNPCEGVIPNKILCLIKKGEGIDLDFKETIKKSRNGKIEREELVKDVVSIANSASKEGHLIFGVRDNDRVIIGMSDPLIEEQIQQILPKHINPPVKIKIENHNYGDGYLSVIFIDSTRKPHEIIKSSGGLRKGAVYIRRGSVIEEATASEVRSFK